MTTSEGRLLAALLGSSLGLFWSCTGEIGDAGGSDESEGPSSSGTKAGPWQLDDVAGRAGEAPIPGGASAATVGLRRLTVDEYDNTICDLVGDCTRRGKSTLVDDLKPFSDFTTQQAQIGDALVSSLEFLATDTAAALFKERARRDRILRVTPTEPDALRKLVTTFGRRALRHPLGEEEVQLFLKLPAVTGEVDFYGAAELIVRAFLQDPEFVHRTEYGQAVDGLPGLFRLTPWELLSRMSYFFWGSMPTDALFDHAQAGGLTSADDIRAVARMMIADQRARRQLTTFHEQWLGYYRLSGTGADDMKAETAALINRVVFEDKQPWREIFSADETFVTYDLAKLYGLALPNDFRSGSSARWVKYSDPGQRGILRHGSFLSLGNKFSDSSPTRRGKEIRQRLFCQEVKDPDVEALAMAKTSVDEPPPPTPTSLCKWDRYEANRNRAAICAGCHVPLDLVGFGLENFDNRGKYRTEQYWSKTVDGVVPAAPGTQGATRCTIKADGQLEGQSFTGPAELATMMLSPQQSASLSACFLKQFYQFSMERSRLDDADKKMIDFLEGKVGVQGLRVEDVLLSIVTSPAFAHRRQNP